MLALKILYLLMLKFTFITRPKDALKISNQEK